ncbi:MAG: DNA mismatch repair protein MutS [Endomicrobium sp.]|jgi:DNA mismatch repair protein MutS|nr:DNA mismatch repair protein MutS [Endomicrobium sp.]
MPENKDNLTPLMQQYWNIKAQYCGMILFFHLGDFYEMFGDDAVKAAPVLEVVLTRRTGVPMCGIPFKAANAYLRKLISKGYKVALCDQLEEPSASKKLVRRGVTRVITPGTILEDTLLSAKQNNFLMSVAFDENSAEAAFCLADISTGDFLTAAADVKSLQSEISKYDPGEILVSSSNFKNKHFCVFIANLKTPVSEVSDSFFDIKASKTIIEETFGQNAVKTYGLDKKEAVCACGAVLNYIRETQPQSLAIFSGIKFLKVSDFMHLDAAAVKNLEILSSMSSGKTENSLLSVMDSTKTSMGARLIRQWLIKPLLNPEKIKNRQNAVKYFIENSDVKTKIAEKLKGVSDIERITARISSQTAHPKDIVALKESLIIINEISDILKSVEGFNVQIPQNAQTISEISSYLNDDPPVTLKDGGVIKSGVNSELDELRKISTDVKAYISELESKERKSCGISNLKIGYTSVFGYYIEISKSNIALAPKHYIRKQTLANCERYITQELKTLEEKILSSQEKTLRLESEIFNGLRRELSLRAGEILKTSQIISEIDIFCGFASNALEYNYSCPQINEENTLSIEEGRHPVVERILKNGEFTANDVHFDDSSRIMILTGPNMSGKSTYLRQTALITIMAQTGSFVPAKSANIGIVDKIFTRIGAGDNLAGGESTFMLEMSETANILHQYTKQSLIILDEVGRGTSTYDGMSIAWAVIEYFADALRAQNKGAKVLFATHYFELTQLSQTLSGVVNFSVDVKEWNGDVIFLHKIKEGSADKSYGIHVAKIAGIPHKVIERAYKILRKLETNRIEPLKHEDSSQQEFFYATEPQILVELKNIDLNGLSPIDAFNLIREWKQQYMNTEAGK